MRKPRKARVFVSRLTTLKGQGDRSFDLAFWQTVSSEERLRAAWDLVELAHKIKGGDPDELRLQRSVEKLERRWG